MHLSHRVWGLHGSAVDTRSWAHSHWDALAHHFRLSDGGLLGRGLLVHGRNRTWHSASHRVASPHRTHHSALHGRRALVMHSVHLGRRSLRVGLWRRLGGHSSVCSVASTSASSVISTTAHGLVRPTHHASSRIAQQVVGQVHSAWAHHSRQRHQHLHEHLHLVLRLLLLPLQVLHSRLLALELVHVQPIVSLLHALEGGTG